MTSRWIAVWAALGLRAGVVFARLPPPRQDDLRFAVVTRLVSVGGVHYVRMTTPDDTFDAVYTGVLPDGICVGQDVIAEGFSDGANGFITTHLTIPACFKGNACRPYACLPDDQRPPECSSARRYE